jgi:hypothetical protein
MPNINIPFDDDELEELKKKKGNRSWREMFLQSTKGFSMGETIPRPGGDLKVVKVEDFDLWNINGDLPTPVPVKPNQIMVYTIYTLEKVE